MISKRCVRFMYLTSLIVGSVSIVTSYAEASDSPEVHNPVPLTAKSVASGRALYLANCSACHGPDGTAQVTAMAVARDLTAPQFFKRGATDEAIFETVQNGLGNGMPPFKSELSDVDTWFIVDFIKSLWSDTAAPR